MEGSLLRHLLVTGRGSSPSTCSSIFGVARCPFERIPKKQKNGASERPDPTPHFEMFVCPRCGFKDDPCWRAHRYMLYVVYTEIDTLQRFQPALAQRLRQKIDVEEGPYVYHLTSSGYVLRTTIELKDFIYKRGLIERHKAATTGGF